MTCLIIVPLIPSDFNITNVDRDKYNFTITFEWNTQPQGVGVSSIVDYYTLWFIETTTQTAITMNTTSPYFTATLQYNVANDIIITAINCAGTSPAFFFQGLQLSK